MAVLQTFPKASDPFRQGQHAGLSFAYGAGLVRSSGGVLSVAAGLLSLTASATNYVEVDPTTGAVSANTTGYTPGRIPLYRVQTDASNIVAVTDDRALLSTAGGGGVESIGVAGDANRLRGDVSLRAGNLVSLSADPVTNEVAIASTAVPPTRQIATGPGLVGGGDLSDDRTLNLAGRVSLSPFTTSDVPASGSLSGTIAMGANEAILLVVSVQPGNAALAGFKFELFAESGQTTLLYQLDTSADPNYTAGSAVRDPVSGYIPVAYVWDAEGAQQLRFKITNLDSANTSNFTVNVVLLPVR